MSITDLWHGWHKELFYSGAPCASEVSPVGSKDAIPNELATMESAAKGDRPVPLLGGEGSAATALRAILSTSAREALRVAVNENDGGRTE